MTETLHILPFKRLKWSSSLLHDHSPPSWVPDWHDLRFHLRLQQSNQNSFAENHNLCVFRTIHCSLRLLQQRLRQQTTEALQIWQKSVQNPRSTALVTFGLFHRAQLPPAQHRRLYQVVFVTQILAAYLKDVAEHLHRAQILHRTDKWRWKVESSVWNVARFHAELGRRNHGSGSRSHSVPLRWAANESNSCDQLEENLQKEIENSWRPWWENSVDLNLLILKYVKQNY